MNKLNQQQRAQIISALVEGASINSAVRITGNFARIHQTIRVTPAMQAGVADHVWSIEEIAGLLN